jgi:hypothetical protein
MLDLKNKNIFIHVHKVAGKSISYAIENNYIPKVFQNNQHLRWNYKKYFLSKTIFAKNDILTTHSQAKDYRDYLKDEFEHFFKFAFVRNPLDWQVSMYFYMKGVDSHPEHKIVKDMNFDQYIEWRCLKELNFQSDYVVEEENKVIVDFIGKYENLKIDLMKIEKETGWTLDIPHINKSNHKHFLNYYSNESKELIYKYFKKDFEILNY